MVLQIKLKLSSSILPLSLLLSLVTVVFSGCAISSDLINTLEDPVESIPEQYQTTWTAAEEKTVQAGEEFSLTITQDQLTFISADVNSAQTIYVTMDYTVTDFTNSVYHLALSNPDGRIVGVQSPSETSPEAATALLELEEKTDELANTLLQTYQDMYIDVTAPSSINIYAAGYEATPVTLFQK